MPTWNATSSLPPILPGACACLAMPLSLDQRPSTHDSPRATCSYEAEATCRRGAEGEALRQPQRDAARERHQVEDREGHDLAPDSEKVKRPLGHPPQASRGDCRRQSILLRYKAKMNKVPPNNLGGVTGLACGGCRAWVALDTLGHCIILNAKPLEILQGAYQF